MDLPMARPYSSPLGNETLRRMANAQAYNDWIYRRLQPFMGNRVLEVGCGIGNMTPYFLDRQLVVSLDLQAESILDIRQQLGHVENFTAIQGDIVESALVQKLRPYQFDTAICLNVLEHIPDDVTALAHMAELLAPGGRLLLFVPAGQWAFGTLDQALDHQRRYDRADLEHKVTTAGLEIEQLKYSNPVGLFGWFFSSRVLRRKLLDPGLLSVFDRLAPWLASLEDQWTPPLGQSLLCIARKPTVPPTSA